MIRTLIHVVGHPFGLWALFIINALGTLYGFVWYESQLLVTPTIFIPFVPDSPTASLFFLQAVLAVLLLRKNSGLLEALAAVTLFKYGIWAVFMNVGAGAMGATLTWQNYMLIASHAGMAIQALLFLPYYRIKPWHLIAAAVWTVHNDIIDYVFGMHPGVHSVLMPHIDVIGYFTFWLGLLGVFIVYWFNIRSDRYHLKLPR
ncbi:LOW QUALITY PROTEIN: hypothetical protein JCM19055_1714 [Geomicrobium sp. JCM 19055]|nr:LOW QUALITY PROTEIN: hypothetical protein JCM19055_1714 [Geomicrobium sp. JCM 19055]